MLSVGDLVICVKDTRGPWRLNGRIINSIDKDPVIGEIYTVAGYRESIFKDRLVLLLQEIKCPIVDGVYFGFSNDRFRKIVDFKYAMEKAEKIKKDQKNPVKMDNK